MTTRAGKGSLRFSPGDFAYNGRASVAILPAMAVVIGFGGPTVVAVCTLGAMAAYLLDALRQKEAALGAVWMTLAAANLFLITGAWIGGDARPLALSLLSLAVCSGVLFLLGCWATLQFRWVQLQYPPVALALERLILSGGVTICGPAIAWGTVAAVGAPAAPFYTACVMPGLHALLSVPLVSSFHLREAGRGGGASGGGRDPAESAAQVRPPSSLFAHGKQCAPMSFGVAPKPRTRPETFRWTSPRPPIPWARLLYPRSSLRRMR